MLSESIHDGINMPDHPQLSHHGPQHAWAQLAGPDASTWLSHFLL